MKHSIFIVEDNRTEGLIMKLAFSGIENVETHYFASGKELLDNLSKAPDVLVLDMILPDIQGIELLGIVRQKSPKTRIVIVSAEEKHGLIAEAQKEGIFNYVVKNESCLRYLKQVMEDLLLIIRSQTKVKVH